MNDSGFDSSRAVEWVGVDRGEYVPFHAVGAKGNLIGPPRIGISTISRVGFGCDCEGKIVNGKKFINDGDILNRKRVVEMCDVRCLRL